MKRGNVIVFIAIVVIMACAIVIAVTPKASNGETDSETTSDLSSVAATSEDSTEIEETTDFTINLDDIVIGTIEDDCVTGTPAPIIDDSTTKSGTTSCTTVNSTTTQEYTYTTKATTTYQTTKNESGMTDVDYLATAIYKEAGADYVSDEARQYVAEVVLNRVASDKFPNTIYGVLTQYRQYGTFYKTGIPLLNRDNAAVERAYRIATDVLNGKREVPSNVVYQAEFIQGSGVWKHIDGIYFCYE